MTHGPATLRPVIYRPEDGIARVTINRPESLNAGLAAGLTVMHEI